jgi:GST-like protein
MTDTPAYTPPEVWVWEKDDSPKWRYSNINRPVAGATHEKELPRGKHPLQLYSLATPNGVKVTIMLEELLASGHSGAEYDAWLIQIGEGNQFGSGFVGVNPNSKIPALVDHSERTPLRVFESGAILLYLADKFGAFLPKGRGERTEALNWLFWQMGSTPYLGGGFGHFYAYAPVKIKYAIDRFSMEVKRQLDVLDRQLADNQFIAGDEYTIADMAIWPWYGNGMLNGASYNDPRTFLQTHEYKNLTRWTKQIGGRPAVKRGRMVNRTSGRPKNNCVSAMMRAISRPKRRTRSARAGNPIARASVFRRRYLVTIGGGEADGADESDKVSHAFQPSGLFWAANSQYPLRFTYPCNFPSGMMYPICGPIAATRDSKLPRMGAAPWSGVTC